MTKRENAIRSRIVQQIRRHFEQPPYNCGPAITINYYVVQILDHSDVMTVGARNLAWDRRLNFDQCRTV